jgi:hypothetical protein
MATADTKAPTPNFVEVFIVVDAEKILAQYPNGGNQDINNPTQLSRTDQRVFMIASKSEVLSGFGGPDLKVQMRTNQQLQILGDSLQPIEYTVLLRRCKLLSGQHLVSPPRCAAIQKTTMAMNPDGRPPEDNLIPVTGYFYRWSMDAERAGQVTYTFTFQIWDNQPRPVSLGFFSWDPYITIAL